MNNWKSVLSSYMLKNNNETLDDIVYNTLSSEEMEQDFDDEDDFLGVRDFTAWSTNFIYDATSDICGDTYVKSFPRNPPTCPVDPTTPEGHSSCQDQ